MAPPVLRVRVLPAQEIPSLLSRPLGSVRRDHGPAPSVDRSLDPLHHTRIVLSTDMSVLRVVPYAYALQRDFPRRLKVGEGTARSWIVGQHRLPVARRLG